MQPLIQLIDKAAEVCGSRARLAKRLGTSGPAITELAEGRRPFSPETVALLCDVLELPGDEVQRLAALAVIDAPKNKERQEVLRRAFFGRSVAGLLACCCTAATVGTYSQEVKAMTTGYKELTFYTLSCVGAALRQAAASLKHWITTHLIRAFGPPCNGLAANPA